MQSEVAYCKVRHGMQKDSSASQPGTTIALVRLHQELIPTSIANMRLLNIKTLKLESFHSAGVAPRYAILSHRWEDEEVLFKDLEERPETQKLRSLQMKLEETERRLDAFYRMTEGGTQTNACSGTTDLSDFANTKFGDQISSTPNTPEQLAHVRESQEIKPKAWAKVLGCCKVAEQLGISYVWIDTCCIDKDSSSELSESINSMFAWYRSASLCIAYLSDVTQAWGSPLEGSPQNSVWFSRGWTLQELIAPEDILFYKGDWTFLGIRSGLVNELHKITRIGKEILQWNGLQKLYSFSVAARMSCKFFALQKHHSS
jgi:hypothetical protein